MTRRIGRSLFVQLALPLAATLLVSFASATGISILVGRRVINQQVTDGLRSEATVVLAHVEHFVGERLAEIELWASDAAMDDALIDDRDFRVQNYLLRLRRALHEQYAELTVVTPSGDVLASTRQERMGRPFDLSQFELQPIEGSLAKQSQVVAFQAGGSVIVFTHPISTRLRAETIGTLVAVVAWKGIEEIVARRGPDESTAAEQFRVLVDRSGHVIAGRQQFPNDLPAELPASLTQPGQLLRTTVEGRGDYVLMATASAPIGQQFRLVVFRDAASAYSVMRIFVGSTVGSAVIGLLLAASTSFLLARAASRRLRVLADGTRRIAEGELSHRVEPLGNDELGELAASFNAMSAQLAGARSGLEQLVETRTAALRDRTEALEGSEARKGSILASSIDAIVTFDAEGRIEEFNPAAVRMFGISREAAIGRSITELIVAPGFLPADKSFGAYLVRAAELLIGQRIETVGCRPGRQEFLIDLALTRIQVGRTALFTAFVRDITADKMAEAELREAKLVAEQAAQVKSDFLANMSHEIRTPMNGIVGMSELLAGTSLNAEQLEYASIIKSSADGLLGIINDILDFSKIEAGKVALEHLPFDVRAVLEGVVELLALPAQAKGLEICAVTDPALPAVVVGDAGRLRQVLLNLAGNAVKFTPAGEVTVTASLQDGVIRFEVADTGVGIAGDALTRLFKPFTQGDASTTRQFGGTGLGLAISKRLVDAMGGVMSVESGAGGGTRFAFALPLELRPQPSRELLPVARGRRALVVGPHQGTRLVACQHLERWGFTVEESSARWEGRTNGYALAVVDRASLEAGGSEPVPIPRDTIPIVFLANVADRPAASAWLRPDIDHCITKPIKCESLRAAVLAALHADVPPAARAPEVVPSGDADGSDIRILVVEDNRVNQKVAVNMLRKAGIACDVADNGRLGLEAFAARHYDLILMDCQMPEMDGYEATALLRRGEKGRRTPVIAMTAGVLSEDRARCFAAGMDDHLSKPVTREALLSIIRKYLPLRVPAESKIA